MDQSVLEAYAQALGLVIGQRRRNWIDVHCPLARWKHQNGVDQNPSMGLQISPSGRSRVKCLSCGFGGDPEDLVLELYRLGASGDFALAVDLAQNDRPSIPEIDYDEALQSVPSKPIPFGQWWVDSFPHMRNSSIAIEYMKNRRVPEKLWDLFDIRHDMYRNRVAFPVRGGDFEIYGLHGRVIGEGQPKYLMYQGPGGITNPQVWYGEEAMNEDPDKPCVFVEGPFDRLRIWQVYRNVVSPLMIMFDERKARRLGDLNRIITLFDPDAAGSEGRSRVNRWWPKADVTHLELSIDQDADKTSLGRLAEMLDPYVNLDDWVI